jgi:two-component system sensor histidine kinase KdpD
MRVRSRLTALVALEIVGALAVTTLLVKALEGVAAVGDLRALYILSVLFIAVRLGGVAAAITAFGSVLVLNFFFVEPRHQLRISHSRDVVALAVFLAAALVVGRLAAQIRERTKEAQDRARLASVRAQEAALVAQVASAVLAGARIQDELPREGDIRVSLNPVPSSSPEEHAVRLQSAQGSGWLYVRSGLGWEREDAERLAGALGRLVDVALERERLAAQAAETEATRRADVAKTAVLHAVSHDFRSPLTAITTAAGGLREGALSAGDREDLLSVIEDESQRLARMVGDLLDLSKIEAGAVHPQTDWCDLRDVVSGAVAQVRAARGDHPVSIELPVDLPLVQADAAQLERVFANLIDNAVTHSPPGVAVKISGGSGAGRVTVRVTDRGRGIPASQRARVFEPFFRGRGAGRGSGLGLAICRGFVEANKGRIQLSVADGTSFAVSFPLVRQPATQA